MSESTTTADRLPVSSARSPATVATAAILAWVLLEFAFRRGLGTQLADPFGTWLAADALMFTLGFPLIAGVVAWWGLRNGIDRSDWEYEMSLRTVGVGLAGAVVYFAVILALVLGLGPMFGIDQSVAPGAVGVAGGPAWALALYLVGNGVIVPISEELAWRGVIQTALTEHYSVAVAVVVTALAFVAKHLVVDMAAPLFRVTSLVVLAFVLCGLRARYGTASSTVAHVVVNGLATATLVVA